jgi:Rrf2 family iron-sulfur cluster assembly transcriptional regulator
VRLQISRRADLAVRALVTLAGASGRVKSNDLATELATTPGFVPQVVGPLVRAGWVGSDPGPTGGYRVLVDPARLTVLDVIEAVDGPTEVGRCVVADRPCASGPVCALHRAWERARAELVGSLRRLTVAELAPGGGR